MRAIFPGGVGAAVFAALCVTAAAAEPMGVCEIEKLVFEGVEQVAVADVRAALQANFDVLLAAHPDGPLNGYLRAIETTAQLAYHHSGFPGAKITAAYDEGQERIVVHVEEGARNFCGEVKIVGALKAD